MEIQVLHRQGKGIRGIERETGHSRDTIRAVLRGRSDGQYGPRQPRPTKIDDYKDYLRMDQEVGNRLSLAAGDLQLDISLISIVRGSNAI